MAGSIVQFVEASGATAATSLGVSFTGTAGNFIYVVACSDDATTTFADTLGNTITERGSVIEAGIPRRMHGATGFLTTGGASTVTVTFGASVSNRQIIVIEVAGVGSYDVHGTATDTGNNPTTAATATNTSQPAFGVAVCLDYQGGTPTVGTGYTSGGVITGGGLLAGRIEYSSPSYTTVASQSANFGNAGFNRTCSTFAIFLEASPPQITVQPTEQSANAGTTATFSVTATGATSYQWQDNSSGSFADIGGATSSSYGASSVTYAMQGRLYRCNVTNTQGTTTSASAALRVLFNLAGTGPRSVPIMGGGPMGNGTVSSWVTGVATAGTGTPVGTAAETDTAFALARVQIKAVGLSAETDTALALSGAAGTPVGLASETDTAFALARVQIRTVGLGTETDTALALGAVSARGTGLASESDTAFARAAVQALLVSLAVETDTAFGLTSAGPLPVGLALEVDTAFSLSGFNAGDITEQFGGNFGAVGLGPFAPAIGAERSPVAHAVQPVVVAAPPTQQHVPAVFAPLTHATRAAIAVHVAAATLARQFPKAELIRSSVVHH